MQASLLQIATHVVTAFVGVLTVVVVTLLFRFKVASSSIRLGAVGGLLMQRELGLKAVQWLAEMDVQPFVGVLIVGVTGSIVGTVGWLLLSATCFPSWHGFLWAFSAMTGSFLVTALWAILGMKVGKNPLHVASIIASTRKSLENRKNEFVDAFYVFDESVRQVFSFMSFWMAVALASGIAGVSSSDGMTRNVSITVLAVDAVLLLRGLYLICPACYTLYGMFCESTDRTSLGHRHVTVQRMNPVMGADFSVAGWYRSSEQRLQERFRWTYTYVCRRCGHCEFKEYE